MAQSAIVCGGSIGGLFAANALRQAGWHVDVFERADAELSGRGAGIVTHTELLAALRAVGCDTEHLGVEVTERVAFDLEGGRVRTIDLPQIVTSWDKIHQVLRAGVPEDNYHLGFAAKTYTQHRNRVEIEFTDGSTRAADVLIGADGFRSAIRAQMLPETVPEYSGYVVWRTLAKQSDLSQDFRDTVFDAFGFFLPGTTQVVGYPIAGPGNDLRPGHRRYNFVWYVPTTPADLDDMLTDESGHQHEMTIPPPLIREAVLSRMKTDAARSLPMPFVEMLDACARPFFTPIYDLLSPVFSDGRVALLGDAACVARPHVGMGVTKAAEDALSLAKHLGSEPVEIALSAYSAERYLAAKQAHDRARLLGSYVVAGLQPGQRPDGRSNPHLDEIMHHTAVVPAQD